MNEITAKPRKSRPTFGKIAVLMTTWVATALVATALIATDLVAADLVATAQQSVATDVANVEPFVSESTFLIVKVDVPQLRLPDLSDAIEVLSPKAKQLSEQMLLQAQQGLRMLQQMVGDQPIYATLDIPVSDERLAGFVFVKDAGKLTTNQLMESIKRDSETRMQIHEGYGVVSPIRGVEIEEAIANASKSSRDGIDATFEAVSHYPIQILIVPPAHVKRTMRELPFELPQVLGGGSSSLLSEGVEWVALGVDPQKLKTELVIHSASEKAANDLATYLPKMVRAVLTQVSKEEEQIPAEVFQAFANMVQPQINGNRVVVQVDGLAKNAANLKLLAVAVQNLEEKSRRHKNRDRFKQIMLSMHNYYDVNKSFPPIDKYRDADGKHHLSWRVHVLPYVEQAELYAQFHLDEPWDSPHNKKLIEKMPDVFKSDAFDIPPKAPIRPGHTTFLAPVGEGTAFGQDKASKFHNFTDGTSNTVVLVEVKPKMAVPWTAPQDYVFDPEDPAAGLQIGSDGKWLCALADGSANQFRGDISAEMILRLFQMNDGNVIEFKKIR